MKICYATDYLPNYHKSWGGAEHACYRLSKLLTQSGHELSILVTKPLKKPEEDSHFFPIPTFEDYLPSKWGLYLRQLKTALFPFDPISRISSYKILRRIRPDILHLHNIFSLSLALVLSARRLKIPVVCSIYDYWLLCPLGFSWKIKDYTSYEGEPCTNFPGPHCIDCLAEFRKLRFLEKSLLVFFLLFRKRLFDFFIKRIDAFIVLSPANAQVLERYGIGKERIWVVHIPLSEDIEVRASSTEKNSILYIGWLHPRKGPHVVVEAMPHILRKIPDAKLYIIGEEANREYMERITSLMEENNLGYHVFLLGRKSYQEVKGFLHSADVLVIPEQWETIAPNALTEGMVFGKAIVASRIGGTLDFIKDGENGLLASVNGPKDFANKIISILNDEHLRLKLCQGARESGLNLFSEQNVYRQLLSLYQFLNRNKP